MTTRPNKNDTPRGTRFTRFVEGNEPRLRRALCARFGTDEGREATAEALAWAWEHWERVEELQNPAGYLYRLAERRMFRWWGKPRLPAERSTTPEVRYEPGLEAALSELTHRQRVAVVLIHGFGWTHREVAELMGISVPAVQKHQERGLVHLRSELGVSSSV